ncbi:phosphatase PAP2 family protein [Spirochaeta cellobiosiphila]|uniref:phosphatase PAP2 family protein n=1 Tax=Spirochaeta cellobiosiphila TaxID=504483 RepID=UPI00040037AD|nr:phosphatase PAP2 family protein [Spirochaeta cellobiosiphila]
MKRLFHGMILTATVIAIISCNSMSDEMTKDLPPNKPTGVKSEFIVEVPAVTDPLPAVDFMNRNDGNGRFYRDKNPVDYNLRGINQIWQGTTEQWQTTAGDYTREANGYKAGDGPGPDDYVPAGTEIKDPASWKANIQYVVKVTNNRSEEKEYFAYLDDIRSKNYGTIDGFGPLTEDYAANSGAYASFNPILLTDVTSNDRYKPDNNDDFVKYGGQENSTLGNMVALSSLFRSYNASTSGPKYLYGTPRPWRMDDEGKINFLGVETLSDVIDGSSPNRDTIEVRIDSYETSVKVIPGLYSARRGHSSSKEKSGLYSADTENRRKDNGYPSGHTNAGVLASLAYAYMMPERFAEQVMRGSDLAENRIIAGMHSPVDIMGGRMQALMVAAAALNNNPEIAEKAYEQSYDYFNPKAESEGMNLYEYAHRTVEEGSFVNEDGTLNVNVFNNNRYSDHEAMKKAYLFRLTYGFPQNGTKGLDPIVPKGAEALLKTRLPYLTDEQRRAVLYTTSIESGYPLLDASNGWGRLNLVAASDGYGALLGDVTVDMDASKGRFNAHDWWRNDISGPGLLTKKGSGTLSLTGDNSFTGGVIIEKGTLEASSTTALGQGDVYVEGGTLLDSTKGSLDIKALTITNGQMAIRLDDSKTQVKVDGLLYLDNAVLTLNTEDLKLTKAKDIKLFKAKAVVGTFASVDSDDYNVSLIYKNKTVIAHIEPK